MLCTHYVLVYNLVWFGGKSAYGLVVSGVPLLNILVKVIEEKELVLLNKL